MFTGSLLDLKRVKWQGPDELTPGRHILVYDLGFTTLAFNNISGIGHGGTGTLSVDGKVVGAVRSRSFCPGTPVDGALVAAAICLATAANAPQTVTFLCAAPARHVCQFAVQTGGFQVAFALPSGERKEVPGIHADKYCVSDPGPVTPNCKRPN